MNREKAKEQAFHYHSNGYHCAEAVSKAILEQGAGELCSNIPKVATAFGGGAVKPFDGNCGALAGGFIAIGSLYGRNEAGNEESKMKCFEIAHEFQKRFLDEMGTTKCAGILEQFGEQNNLDKCRRLSGFTAGILADILDEKG